jgi:hypothetical protein
VIAILRAASALVIMVIVVVVRTGPVTATLSGVLRPAAIVAVIVTPGV